MGWQKEVILDKRRMLTDKLGPEWMLFEATRMPMLLPLVLFSKDKVSSFYSSKLCRLSNCKLPWLTAEMQPRPWRVLHGLKEIILEEELLYEQVVFRITVAMQGEC